MMEDLKANLKKVIQALYNLDFEPEISPSPENIDADYSTNAPLKLAKELKRPPMEIAKKIIEGGLTELIFWGHAQGRSTLRVVRVPRGGLPELTVPKKQVSVTPSISQPGFINFKLTDEYLAEKIDGLAEDFSEEVRNNEYAGKTVICEFSDPNPFKVLHVGHLYTSIVGDSISKLFEYAGAKVIRANFGGDVGLHVAKTMYILRQKNPAELTIEDIANCYIEGTAAYEDDETARHEITHLNKEIYKINAEGITRTGDANRGTPKMFDEVKILGDNSRQDPSGSNLADLYWKGRELSYKYFDRFYNSIGVKFDKYYPESTVANLGLQKVKEELKKDVYEMSDGAVIFNGEKFGLHTRVFINKEGVPTYEAKDVGLIFQKWNDYHFDKSVVITGSEQLDYMKVVLKSVEEYAPELVKKTTHLTHGLVKLPGGVKMSSRKGNFLKAVDVLDMVKEELKNEYNSTDEKVSLAATKYAFLKYKMGGNIIFDPKESVKTTGNSGPYLLYSSVRAKKILGKSDLSGRFSSLETVSREPYETSEVSEPHNDRSRSRADEKLAFRIEATPNGRPLVDGRERAGSKEKKITTQERGLMKKLLEYKSVLDEAVTEMAPHKVANYLYELAQEFSRFYEACPVVGSEFESERIKLVKVYADTMTHGLNILGIEIPEEM